MEIELHDAKTNRTVWSRVYMNEGSVARKEVPDVAESLDQNLRQRLSEMHAMIPPRNRSSVGEPAKMRSRRPPKAVYRQRLGRAERKPDRAQR
jgi:hypothetical protein